MAIENDTNLNHAYQTNFLMSFDRVPIASFTCQKAQIPGISLGEVKGAFTTGYFTKPGDLVEFRPLVLQCYLTEDLRNYLELHDWLRGMSASDGFAERVKYLADYDFEVSDATLQITSNSLSKKIDVRFESMFPVDIDTIDFDVTIEQPAPIVFGVTFAYTRYKIELNQD